MAKKDKSSDEYIKKALKIAAAERAASKAIDKNLTLREQEVNIQKENLSVNKELLRIQRQKGTLNENDVSDKTK